MKIDAKITWNIDDADLGIEADKSENVPVDIDYVRSDVQDVTDWIENALSEKYGKSFYEGNNDFSIDNMDEVLEEIAFSEYEDKVDPGYDEYDE